MTSESIAERVVRWIKEMGIPVTDDPFQLQELKDSLHNPAMKGALLHFVQHVCPKQEVEKINKVLAEYEFLKMFPGDKNLDVSIHMPEHVTLFKRREKLKQILREKRKEEDMLDEEIKCARSLLKEKKLSELSLQKAVKNKEHKSNGLKLKYEETKQIIAKISKANEKISSILNCQNENDEDTALILIKQSILQLMSSNKQSIDLSSEFWTAMREDLLTQPPAAVIEAVTSFCQKLCTSIDALVLNQCEPQIVADFSPVENELATLRSELDQTHVEHEKAQTSSRELSNSIENLFAEITKLLMKDESNPDIGRIKLERIRESVERANLETQLEDARKYLTDLETNNENLDSESTIHNLSIEQKKEVQNTILYMESQAQSIRDHLIQFQNPNEVFAKLKTAQDESLQTFRENMDKLTSLKVKEFHNKLVQVYTLLVQISDDCYSNNIDKFPVETGAVDFKQLHHSLSYLSTLKQMKPLPDISVDQDLVQISPCKLPECLDEEAIKEMKNKQQELREMFFSLSSTN